ncbi:MAG: alpha-hydroxy-acid oxidizing protein [Alphaproteobacteria bacterium]|nr:alpha-hydroxy-acid oxidizing protein [Alphaproteobacteria bacterium]
MAALDKVLTIEDMKELARRRVPKLFFDYADSGSLTEQTYRANSEDFDSILLRQRVARRLGDRSLKSTMMGEQTGLPIALSPVGSLGMHHADGEIHVQRAAEKHNVPFILSTMSVCSIEDVAAATSRPFWFQLYVMRDRDFALSLLERARAAGVKVFVLTLDLQLYAQRHKDLRNELRTPPKLTPKHMMMMAMRPRWSLGMAMTRRHTFRNVVGHVKGVRDLGTFTEWTNSQFDPELDWTAVKWFRDHWDGKFVLKGITDEEDARIAVDHGADALIVSNHGGRQLDGAPSSIRSLPRIVETVGDRIEVHVDGGVRTGVDVFRALALGARAVHVGRAYTYGLGAAGEAGVLKSLDILKNELDQTMALCGERNVTDIGRHNLVQLPAPLLTPTPTLAPKPTPRPARKTAAADAGKPAARRARPKA